MRAHSLNHYYAGSLCVVTKSDISQISFATYLYVIPFLLFSVFSFAQPTFKVFDTEFGLSHRDVTSIVHDQSGYLWVGTEDGLNRFDGNSFKVYKYNPINDNSLSSNQISCLAVDKSNRIWIGHGSSVTRYDQSVNLFTRYKINKTDSTSVCWISFISFDKYNRIWLSVVGSGLIVLNPETGAVEKRIGPARFLEIDFHVNGMSEDSTGNVWLATQDGLYLYDRKLDAVKPVRAVDGGDGKHQADHFKGILDDRKGGFWLASNGGGICHYSPKRNTFVTYKSEGTQSNLVLDIARKSEKELWLISKDKGKPIGIFDTQRKTFSFLKLPYVLESEIGAHSGPFTDLYVDRNDIAWIASRMGLIMINPEKSLNLIPLFETDSRIKIRAIVEDTVTMKKFFATELGLVITNINDTKGHSFPTGADGVQDLLNTSGDSLWVLLHNKVRLFDKVSEKWIDLPGFQKFATHVIPGEPYFKKMIRALSGDYWAITYLHGAYRSRKADLNFQEFIANAKVANSICSNSLADLLEDKFGRIWFASHDAGICIFDPVSNTFKTLNDNEISPFLPTSDISNMDVDREGNIWLATLEVGVMKINVVSRDSLSLTIFDQELLSIGADELKIDEQGRVWVKTLNGINILDPKTMNIKSFEKRDGLIDLADHNLLKSNNRVLVNGSFGCGLIDERNLLPDMTLNPFVINAFKVFGKEIYPQGLNHDQIFLPYDQNSIAIDFAAIDFLNSKKIRYSYKLEGVEGNEWSAPSNNRSTEFAHLPGGNYIFKLKTSNQDGVWSKEKNLLYIHIETPYWEANWFYALLIVAGMGIIGLFYIYQINRIKNKEKERSEINKRISQLQLKALHTQMRPHFIFNCLSAINSHIVKFETVKASEFLSQFSRLMRGILENSTESWITLEQEVETLRLYLIMEGLRFEDKFSYKIEVEEGIHPTTTLIPSMIVQPYVENAIGHGLLYKEHGIGIVTIKFLKGDGNIKCIIEDNGIGRERSNQIRQRSKFPRKSLGLQITSERLQLLQGSSSADIQDLKNELGEPTGTRIVIMLMTKKVEDKDLVNLN